VPQLTIAPSLLVIQPLQSLKDPITWPEVSIWAEKVHIEHMRDRGHLRELIGAVKQKEHSQGEINAAAAETARIRRETIDKINAVEVKVKKPSIFKRIF